MEDVVKLILQFCKEQGLPQSLNALRAETDTCRCNNKILISGNRSQQTGARPLVSVLSMARRTIYGVSNIKNKTKRMLSKKKKKKKKNAWQQISTPVTHLNTQANNTPR